MLRGSVSLPRRQIRMSSVTAWTRARHAWNVFLQDTRDVVSGDILRPPVPKPVPLVRFRTQDDVNRFRLLCDSQYGGHSQATFELGEGSEPDRKCGVLSGFLSVAPATNPDVKRSGFIGITSPEQFPPWNVALAPNLDIRCRTDGRLYAINIHCEMAFETGLFWQGFITGGDGEWHTLQLPLSRFLPVMAGRLAAGKWNMNLESIIKVGVSVMGKQGPFKFELESMTAMPSSEENDAKDDSTEVP